MHPDQLHQLATLRHRETVSAAAQYRDRRAARRRARPGSPRSTTRGRRTGSRRRQQPDPGTARSPRSFHRLWRSASASNLADGILFAGLPVLATQVTDSPVLIAGVVVALLLPMALSALPAGVIADRFDGRQVLFVGNLMRVFGLGVVLVAVLTGELGLAAIYTVAAITGSSEILVDTTAQTVVVEHVAPGDLPGANARLGGTQVVMNDAIGAPIGSFLAGAGAGIALGVPALLFALAALVIRRLPIAAPIRKVRTGPVMTGRRTDVAVGVRYLTDHPVLDRVAVANAASNLGSAAFFAVFVLFVVDALDLPTATYGWFLAAVALGGLAGSLAASRIIAALGHAATFKAVALGAIAVFGVASATSSATVVAGALALLGAGALVSNIATRVLRQTLVPSALLGRVTATMALVALSATPIGAMLGGVTAELAGVRAAGVVAAAAHVAAVLLLVPVTADAIAAAHADEQGTASGLDGQTDALPSTSGAGGSRLHA